MRRLLLSMSLFCILSANAVTTPEDTVPEQEVKHVRGAGALLELIAATRPHSPVVVPHSGHYTITQAGSYEVKNSNYANDTPAPYPDTPPAPGSMKMARGIDRNDLSRSKLPIFHWTWTNFMNSVNDMNGGLPNSTTRAASTRQTAPPCLNLVSHSMLFRQQLLGATQLHLLTSHRIRSGR